MPAPLEKPSASAPRSRRTSALWLLAGLAALWTVVGGAAAALALAAGALAKALGLRAVWRTRASGAGAAGSHPCTGAADRVPVDILVSHGPCKGRVDGGAGCGGLAEEVRRRVRPGLVVSGHIHQAHGQDVDEGGVRYVNAAICGGKGYSVGWGPVVVEI